MALHPRARMLPLAAAVVLATLGASGVPAGADKLERARAEREVAEAELDEVVAGLEAIGVRITEAEDARERLDADLMALQHEAEAAEAVLAARAVRAYVQPNAGVMSALLASAGPGQAAERARLLEGLGRQQQEAIERAAAARAAYDQRRAELDAVLAELDEDHERAALLRERLDEAFRVIRARERELESRRERQRRVSRSGQQGVYACPIAPPFWFRDTWGAPRSGGRWHRGVDIFGDMGAEVYAITHGVVARHSNSRLGGIGLYLAGDDGNQYYYAHLQRILPDYEPGTRVEAGELMALNGDTGNASASAPHIHMEVRPGAGAQVNPYPYAAAACH